MFVTKKIILITTTVFFLLNIMLCACNIKEANKKRNIRTYYYPIESFMEGKVYEYQAVNDSLAPFYWYFQTEVNGKDTILKSEYYDHNFEIQQATEEEIVSNGVLLNAFFLYDVDTLSKQKTQNPVKIEADNVFPFEVSDSTGLFLYKIFWNDYLNPKQKYRLIKNKHFIGDAHYTLEGKEVKCVKFLNRELLEIEEEGFQELKYQGVELYAAQIGLIYFRKEIEGNIVQEYQLARIYDIKEMETQLK